MSEALRGTRLGATSLENDRDVEFAPRMTVTYNCPAGHVISLPFAAEAEVPIEWECDCGELALLTDATKLDVVAPCAVARLDELDRVISDGAPPWLAAATAVETV